MRIDKGKSKNNAKVGSHTPKNESGGWLSFLIFNLFFFTGEKRTDSSQAAYFTGNQIVHGKFYFL